MLTMGAGQPLALRPHHDWLCEALLHTPTGTPHLVALNTSYDNLGLAPMNIGWKVPQYRLVNLLSFQIHVQSVSFRNENCF